MQDRSKWLGKISADDSITDAARLTLKSRLTTVAHFLDLAAHHADRTPEHVHQLRVYTRRSLAALNLYEEVLTKKQTKWFRRWLRRIRKAAGDARDLDVFLQRYEQGDDQCHATFLRRIKKRRRKAQRPIVKLDAQLIATHRFERHIDRLLQPLSADTSFGSQRLGQWAKSKLARTARKFFDAIPQQPTDLKALHRFRVRGKQLRYTMELFSTVFPADLRTSIYPLVSELQDRLGEVNDHATACRHLQTWSAQTRGDSETDHLSGLVLREQTELDLSIERFRKWWTPEFVDALESALHAMTADA